MFTCVRASAFLAYIVLSMFLGSVCARADEPPRKLDVVVIMDVTNSMGSSIDAAKSNLGRLAKELKSRSLDVRFAVITLSDRVPYESLLPFTASATDVAAWIANQPLANGGDPPENPLDPVNYALAMPYRPDADVAILLITDNKPHEAGDGTSITKQTVQGIADLYSGMDTRRFRIFYSAPVDDYGAFATSVDWPFSADTLLYTWISRIQGIELPLQGNPADYERWRAGLPEGSVALAYEDWTLLNTLAASQPTEGSLQFEFLTESKQGIPWIWPSFFERFGAEGRRALQRLMQMGYRLRQVDYWAINRWWSIDEDARVIEFENATGLFAALKRAIEREGLSEAQWGVYDDIFAERVATLTAVNPRLTLGTMLANREAYSALSPDHLRKDAQAYLLDMQVHEALDENIQEALQEAQQKGWRVEVRKQWSDWSLDDAEKVIYIGAHEYTPEDAPKQFREALLEANSRLTERDVFAKYIERYGKDPQAQHFLNLLGYSDYQLRLDNFWVYDKDVDKEAKTIVLDSTLDLDEAVTELHASLEDVFGSAASRFTEGAGRKLSSLEQLSKLDERTLAEIGATDIVARYRTDFANGVAAAGGVQDEFVEQMAWEAGSYLAGAALARAPELLHWLKSSKRLQPNSVTHFRHTRFDLKGAKPWLEAAASPEVAREIDDLTVLLRESAEKAVDDVHHYRALPRRPGVVGEGHLRRYLREEMPGNLDELRRSGRGQRRMPNLVGNAYHQRLKLVVEERLRSDPRFAKYRDRLSCEKYFPGRGGRTDVRLQLPDGKFAVWDLTSAFQLGHVEKYAARSDVAHLIELLYVPAPGAQIPTY